MTKVSVIKYMFRSEWKVLTDALHSGTVYEAENIDLTNDLTTLLSGRDCGMIVASLKTSEDLVQLASLVKAIKRGTINTYLKILVINFTGSKHFDKAVAKLNLDLLEENIQPKALRFKIDFMMKSINAQMKRSPQNAQSNNVKSLQENPKNQEKKVLENGPIWAEPLECEDDIWLMRNDTDCKKILTRWLVKLIGPSPYVASWVETETSGVWRFDFKGDKSLFSSGKGSWFYKGEQKPDFVWAENSWSFTGSNFGLYFKENNTTFHRMFFKEKQLTISKTSLYAKTKEQVIIESFDKDLVFKKEVQSNAANKAFENEQNKLKNLEGKGKTDTLTQGPLSGKGKTEVTTQGPLSGKGNTSNITNNPLSMDLKPEDNSADSGPLIQKKETEKNKNYWKGKNPHETDAKPNLEAPVDEQVNIGAELALETKSGIEKYYKNHNEAEKFASKDIGHSIKKDGVSENLKGKTDPTKLSQNAGGEDLAGKNNTDKLAGHLSSPNAKKEKQNQEKTENELSGKNKTDQLAGHLSSPNAKKEKSINEEDEKENELAGKSSTDKIQGHLASTVAKKEHSTDKHSDDKKEIYRRNTTDSNKRKEKFDSDELNNELDGKERPFAENETKSEREKTENEKRADQLASLRLKKQNLEKERKAKEAENASSEKNESEKRDGAVDKISTNYSSKKRTGDEKPTENENIENVLPFAEKEKNKVQLGFSTKELDNATESASVTSMLTQGSVKINCTLDDFFDQTIIFCTDKSGITNETAIQLNLSFSYMSKETNLKFQGKVVGIEDDGEGNRYISVQISHQNSNDFNAFMKLYNTRQENINFFLNAAKG